MLRSPAGMLAQDKLFARLRLKQLDDEVRLAVLESLELVERSARLLARPVHRPEWAGEPSAGGRDG